jgi:hypothetical protein
MATTRPLQSAYLGVILRFHQFENVPKVSVEIVYASRLCGKLEAVYSLRSTPGGLRLTREFSLINE